MGDIINRCRDSFVFNYAFKRVVDLIKEQNFHLVLDSAHDVEDLHVYFSDFIKEKYERIYTLFAKRVQDSTVSDSYFRTELAIQINYIGFLNEKSIMGFLDTHLDPRSPYFTDMFLEEKFETVRREVEDLFLKVISYLQTVSAIASTIYTLIDHTVTKAKRVVVQESWMTQYDVEKMQKINRDILAQELKLDQMKTKLNNLKTTCDTAVRNLQLAITEEVQKTKEYAGFKVKPQFEKVQDVKKVIGELASEFNAAKPGVASLAVSFFSLQPNVSAVQSYIALLKSKEDIEAELEAQQERVKEAADLHEKFKDNQEQYKRAVHFFKTDCLKLYNRCVHNLVHDLSS